MKKQQIQIGQTYRAKVSGNIVDVRIDRQNPRGGWDATNTKTNKSIRIHTAGRLRGPGGERITAHVEKAKAATPVTPAKQTVARDEPTPAKPTTPAEPPLASAIASIGRDAVANDAPPDADAKPHRLSGTPRVERITPAMAKARNLSRTDGKTWTLDESAAAARTPATPAKGKPKRILDAIREESAINAARNAADAPAREAKAAATIAKRTESLATARQRVAVKRAGKPSGLDVAHAMLIESGTPAKIKDLVDSMLRTHRWQTNGKTPAATIYAAILRDIKAGKRRFQQTAPGTFAAIAG